MRTEHELHPSLLREAGKDLLIFDFDHTLLGANSSELFISNAVPSFAAAILDVTIRGGIPWRILPVTHPHRVRDWACILSICLLMPWNIILWIRKAPRLFRKLEIELISSALTREAKEHSVIITFGTKFVVRSLLRGSEWESTKLIGNPLLGHMSYFTKGKLALAQEGIGLDQLRGATFLTDSSDDADLLGAVKNGILIQPQGEAKASSQTNYFPLRYTANVKYPRRYVLDQLLLVDVPLLIMSVNYSSLPIFGGAIATILLYLSVMCVYEVGYFENDMKASTKERSPTIGPLAHKYKGYPIRDGFYWAFAFSAIAHAILYFETAASTREVIYRAVVWMLALTAIYAVFKTYNALQPSRRVFMYLLLQISKYISCFALVPLSFLGTFLIAGQALTMWIHYIVYRSGGNVKLTSKESIRFCITASLIVLSIMSSEQSVELYSIMAFYFFWTLFRMFFGPLVLK